VHGFLKKAGLKISLAGMAYPWEPRFPGLRQLWLCRGILSSKKSGVEFLVETGHKIREPVPENWPPVSFLIFAHRFSRISQDI